MAMTITERLKAEHGVFLFQLDHLRRLLEQLRSHLEHEIHDLFALADELIPAEHLVSLSNWDVEHLYEANGRWPLAERPVI